MATKTEIEQGLATYFDEMRRCAAARCNWALAHLLIIMPDICAALEHGNTTERWYRAWCERWFDCTRFNGIERYKLRCGMLHEGQARPDERRLRAGEELRYDRFSFGPSGSPHMISEGRLLHLDVAKLHEESVQAIGEWAGQMERDRTADIRTRLAELAQARPVQVEEPPPLPMVPTPNRMIMPGAIDEFAPRFFVVTTRYVTS
jgi:hypothetical protein